MREPPRPLKAPVELAALKGRLVRAEQLETSIGAEGKKIDDVLDSIEARRDQISGYRGQLEEHNNALGAVIDRMLGTSNNPPNGSGSPGDVEREKQVVSGDQVGDATKVI